MEGIEGLEVGELRLGVLVVVLAGLRVAALGGTEGGTLSRLRRCR